MSDPIEAPATRPELAEIYEEAELERAPSPEIRISGAPLSQQTTRDSTSSGRKFQRFNSLQRISSLPLSRFNSLGGLAQEVELHVLLYCYDVDLRSVHSMEEKPVDVNESLSVKHLFKKPVVRQWIHDERLYVSYSYAQIEYNAD